MSEDDSPEYRVYGGKATPNYHLVTATSIALEDWTAICGHLVTPARKVHRWGEGDAYCEECEVKAGPAMRAQEAREEAERGTLDYD
jgi:hypothetical protein